MPSGVWVREIPGPELSCKRRSASQTSRPQSALIGSLFCGGLGIAILSAFVKIGGPFFSASPLFGALVGFIGLLDDAVSRFKIDP